MTKLLFAAAALGLAISPPAFAKPGKGQGHKGHGYGHQLDRDFIGYGRQGCPPGLRDKPRCMPPGQHKKLFGVGQRVPLGYHGLLGYDRLPYDLRHRYGAAIDPYSRYIYRDDYLYRVDPRTMLVTEILRSVL